MIAVHDLIVSAELSAYGITKQSPCCPSPSPSLLASLHSRPSISHHLIRSLEQITWSDRPSPFAPTLCSPADNRCHTLPPRVVSSVFVRTPSSTSSLNYSSTALSSCASTSPTRNCSSSLTTTCSCLNKRSTNAKRSTGCSWISAWTCKPVLI